MAYLRNHKLSDSTITRTFYEKINEGQPNNRKKFPFPKPYAEHVANNTSPTSAVLAGNVEILKHMPTVKGGISINEIEASVFGGKLNIPTIDIENLTTKEEIAKWVKQIKRLVKDKKLKLIAVGNLPFGGSSEKLWQQILQALKDAGFDEIHLIIPASGVNSREMKQSNLEGLKSVHFMSPEQWLDDNGNYDIVKPCAMVEVHKGYTGDVSVYYDFDFLYSRPFKDDNGRRNFLPPVKYWPEIEDVLANLCGTSNFLHNKEFYAENFGTKRIDRPEHWVTSTRDAVVDFDSNGVVMDKVDKHDRWYDTALTQDRVFFGGRGLESLKNLVNAGPVPSGLNQSQWFEPDTPGCGDNLIQLLQLPFSKALIVATLPDTAKPLNTPALRLLSVFDIKQKWTDTKIAGLFKPKHIKALDELVKRYRAIYK